MTLLSMSSRSSVDRVAAMCLGGHVVQFLSGNQIFLSPTPVSCWSILFSCYKIIVDVFSHTSLLSMKLWSYQSSVDVFVISYCRAMPVKLCEVMANTIWESLQRAVAVYLSFPRARPVKLPDVMANTTCESLQRAVAVLIICHFLEPDQWSYMR